MILRIIRKSYFSVQTIFYAIRRRRNAKKMMNYCLGIKPNPLIVNYKTQGEASNGK